MFSLDLYKEGLRRSLPLSALFMFIMLLGAVLIPVVSVMNHISFLESETFHFHMAQLSNTLSIRGFGNNYALLLAIFAYAPLLTLYLFAFLNKRNASDFYHSIPHKRETLYFSFLAAVLTHVLAAIWICTGITIAIYAGFAEYTVLNIPHMLLVSLGLSIGCIMVIGATLIAMSITGSTFINIITALIIIFLPGTLVEVFFRLVISITPVVSVESFGFLGAEAYGIPFASTLTFLSALFGLGMNLNGDIATLEQAFTGGILFTSASGLIYLCIGLILFQKRKSEAAGSLVLNSGAQLKIRIATTFCFCLPAMAILVGILGGGHIHNMTAVIIFYAIALAAYFAYELALTKKLSNIVKSLPGLAAVIALNIVFIAGVMTMHNSILNRQPTVNEIESVRILSLSQHHDFRSAHASYSHLRTREVELRGAALSAFLLDLLSQTVENIRSGNNANFTQITTVAFTDNSGNTMTRRLQLNLDEARSLTALLAGQEDYAQAFLSLPQEPRISSNNGFARNVPQEALNEVFEIMRQELRGMDFDTWFAIRFGSLPGVIRYSELSVGGELGDYRFNDFYPVTNLTPQTADALIRVANTYNAQEIINALEDMIQNGLNHMSWLSVNGINVNGGFHAGGFEFVEEERTDNLQLLLYLVREQEGVQVNRDEDLYMIDIRYLNEEDEWFFGSFFLNSDNLLLQQLVGQRGRW